MRTRTLKYEIRISSGMRSIPWRKVKEVVGIIHNLKWVVNLCFVEDIEHLLTKFLNSTEEEQQPRGGLWIILQRSWSTCWTKQNKWDVDLPSLDTEGNDGTKGQSHPPRCTTARDDRWIRHMAGMDRAATSRTIAQRIQSVTHHSVSACRIRRRLQHSGTSAKRLLLHLLLTENHRYLSRKWTMNGGYGQLN
ncbi:transposable element Tc1 transposase [Trichonephila clavipes]|nr:transposable element Tc1 transposase [Trichonephila clavipes]